MATVRQQLRKQYDVKVVERLEKTVRAVAFVIDAELQATTPIDTGRARANWLPSLNTPDNRQIQGPQSNHPPIAPILTAYKITDSILLTNNLPYIQRLNNGSSVQAPAGFVDIAIARGKRAIK